MKTVAYSPAAARQLRKLDRAAAGQIAAKMAAFAESGRGDVTAMKGAQDTFRLRMRDWRVVFTDDGTEIEIVAVGHRREIYDREGRG